MKGKGRPKKPKAKKPRQERPVQGELEGMRPKRNKIVEKAMLEYLDDKDEHAKTTKAITNSKRKVFRTLKEQDIPAYKLRDVLAKLTVDEDVEIKTIPKAKKDK